MAEKQPRSVLSPKRALAMQQAEQLGLEELDAELEHFAEVHDRLQDVRKELINRQQMEASKIAVGDCFLIPSQTWQACSVELFKVETINEYNGGADVMWLNGPLMSVEWRRSDQHSHRPGALRELKYEDLRHIRGSMQAGRRADLTPKGMEQMRGWKIEPDAWEALASTLEALAAHCLGGVEALMNEQEQPENEPT